MHARRAAGGADDPGRALEVIGRSGARVLFVAEDFLGVDRLGALRRALVLAWGTSAEHRARVLREL